MGKKKEFAVLGLGKFGISLAKCLSDSGCEVMVVDANSEMVNIVADYVVHAEVGDVTNKDFIYALGLSNYDGVIVGIGIILKRELWQRYLPRKPVQNMCLQRQEARFMQEYLKKSAPIR